MFDFFTSKKGSLTFTYNGNLIHSSYDPLKEAEKYINIHLKEIKTRPPVFLIVYPGLNYIYDILSVKYSSSRFVVIHSSEDIFSRISSKYSDNTSVWHPGKKQDLTAFLRNEIREIELKGLQILNWTPVFSALEEACSFIDSSVSRIIREYNGNINTLNYFGKRYFKNVIKNVLSLKQTVSFSKTEKPVVITSSGPSLEKSADFIKKNRKSIFLLSLSSSLTFLLENNIEPDLFLTSDPGFYSTYHTKKINKSFVPAAVPLTSYHLNFNDKPLLLLNQNTLHEKLLLRSFPLKMHSVQQNGTVSGTALDLALLLTDYPVFFAGLDFCSSDIKSHCSPDEFSIPEIAESSRLNSYLHKLYSKYSDFYTYKTGFNNNRTSIQLKTYSSWFENLKPDRDIYRVNSTEININSFKTLNSIEADSLIRNMNTENNHINQTVSDIDKRAVRISLVNSLSEAILSLKISGKSALSYDYFSFFDNDILYNYSASVYLDIYGDYFSGNREKADKKYSNLIDECIAFFESLKNITENHD